MNKCAQVACLIPCYNEVKNIAYLCSEIENNNSPLIDWYIINNGSKDIGDKDFKQLIDQNTFSQNIFFLNLDENRGYGDGLKRASRKLNFEYRFIGWTHADGQTPIKDIIKAVNISREDKDINLIKGVRVYREDGFLASLFTFLLNVTLFSTGKFIIRSPNSQPTLVNAKLFNESIFKLSDDGRLDISIMVLFKKNGYSIRRFPVKFLKRRSGEGVNESFIAKLKFSLKTLIYLLDS